jgi:hypothetical protein
MIYNLPQFLDTEDKIVGPITGKQLAWMFGAAAVLLVIYTTLDQISFYLSAIPVVAITLALAFYRPYNQPLIKFVFATLFFLFRPKTYLWKRLPDFRHSIKKAPTKKTEVFVPKKKLEAQKIHELSQILDNK